MFHFNCLSFAAVQGNPMGESLAGWIIGALRLNSISSLLVLLSGGWIFGGACYLIATKRRTAALAACLVFLPLPVFIALFGVLSGTAKSLIVISAAPGMSLSTDEIAGGIAVLLTEVLFALLISAPSYFVVGGALLLRTLNSGTDSPTPTSVRSTNRNPLLSSDGSMPAST